MITAKEANEYTCAALALKYKDFFDEIEKKINEAIEKGEFHCTVRADYFPISCTQVAQVLREEEFRCDIWANCKGWFIDIYWERD